MKQKLRRRNSVVRPLALFLAIAIIITLFTVPGRNPTAKANEDALVTDSPVTIMSLPSYDEHVENGHRSVKNVAIDKYAANPGAYPDYWLRIDNAAHLSLFSKLCNGDSGSHYLALNYLLGNNIDYAKYFEDTSEYFLPIGTANTSNTIPFTGIFDGQGFEIKNLVFEVAELHVNQNRYFAFFGANAGIIRNFGLVTPIINTKSVGGDMFVSGIAGKNMSGGLIEYVYVDDTLFVGSEIQESKGYIGLNSSFAGLVSLNEEGATLSNAYYSGIVSTSGCYANASNIRPVVLQNNGSIEEAFYNKTVYGDGEAAPLGMGSGEVIGVAAANLVLRSGCLTDARWRTHAYEAILNNATGLAHMRSNPRLYGFSGRVSSGWGVTDTNPLLISTPADLVYFPRFFEANITNVTTNRKYLVTQCIDMSTVAADAYYFNNLNTTNASGGNVFSFSAEVKEGHTCDVPHYETTAGAGLCHAIINLQMTKSVTDQTFTYGVNFNNAEVIGFIPGNILAGSAGGSGTIQNLNFIGGLCQPALNSSAGAIFAGAVSGLGYIPMQNVHSSMDIIIPDGETCPFYAGGLIGYSKHLSVQNVSFSGKVSGGIHPYIIVPKRDHNVGGIVGGLSGDGPSAATFQNILSDGVLEAAGFFGNIPLVDGKYVASNREHTGETATSYHGTTVGGLFGGQHGVTAGSGDGVIDSLTLLNRSDIYTVPMKNGTTPRTGPNGEPVYALSAAVGGIMSHGFGFEHNTPTYVVNYGNIYCYNLIGSSAIGGLLGSNARTSHGSVTDKVVNYGDIIVKNSSGNIHVAGIQSKMYWAGYNAFFSAYNYGDITVDDSNSFDTCAVAGISAMGRIDGGKLDTPARDGYNVNRAYNYGNITVNNANADSCMLYVGGITAYSVTAPLVVMNNTINTGAISVATTQTSGELIVSGLSQHSMNNSANLGPISVNATGSMTGNIYVGGLCGATNLTSFKNSVNAGKIDVTANTSGNVYTGGIYPFTNSTTVTHACLNSGGINVTNNGSGGAFVGGITGHLGAAVARMITDSINSGDISVKTSGIAATYTGGIVGQALTKFKVMNCINYGAISSETTTTGKALQYTGGLAGQITFGIKISDTNEVNSGAGFSGMINFGDINAVSAASDKTEVLSGGITGYFQLTTALANFADLVNNGNVTSPGATIGSIAGKLDLGNQKITTLASYLNNHLNTVESLNLYGTASGLNSTSTLTSIARTGIYTVNPSDSMLGTATVPFSGMVKNATNDESGIYEPQSAAMTELGSGRLIFAESGSLAAARWDAFPSGMYALLSSTLDTLYLPETLDLALIDPPKLNVADNSAGKKDMAWRTQNCFDIDGNTIAGSSVDEQYEFIKQVDNDPQITDMALETTTYYTLCGTCENRFRADLRLEELGVDTFNMTPEQMSAALTANAVTCDNCGAASNRLGAVYSEYTIDKIQKRDNETNTLYFYATENHIGSSFKIKSWKTNFGTVVADVDTETKVETLRFELPDSYDGSQVVENIENKVYLMAAGGEPVEYTVVVVFLPDPKINLVSVTSSKQDTVANPSGTLQYHPAVTAANLKRDADGAYIVPNPIYYAGTYSSSVLRFYVQTENVAPGFMPRYNTTITHDETGDDYTHIMVRNDDTDRFYFSNNSTRWKTSLVQAADGPKYATSSIDDSGSNVLYTEALDATYPDGWYTIEMSVNGKVLLAIRFERNQNSIAEPVESDYYKLDRVNKIATRINAIYGLAERTGLFYPLGAPNRSGDVLLYPSKGSSDRFGAISNESERLLVGVTTNPDGTHTYTNKVSYIPETGIADKAWWTVNTTEALPPSDALKITNVLLNGTSYTGGNEFQVEIPGETKDHVVRFTGVFDNIDHSEIVASTKIKMYIEFGVKYFDGETTVDLTQVADTNIYSPKFSLDGKTVLTINQVKTVVNNASLLAHSEYEYTFTLDKNAPVGDYEVYFIYKNSRTLKLTSFNDIDKTYVENAESVDLSWLYEFPKPFVIRKPMSTDSYLWSFTLPGSIYETILCKTEGHTHNQVASVSNGVINYSTSPRLGDDRDTHYKLDVYFPANFDLADVPLTMVTANGASIERMVDDVWEPVEHSHNPGFAVGGTYEYRITSQQSNNVTYYTFEIKNLERNKTLNIGAEGGAGVGDIQELFESLPNEDLMITLKQIVTDAAGNSKVSEMYNATFICNNGLHLPYAFPLVSAGTYVIDAHVPEGYGFEVLLGFNLQTGKDEKVSGVKFTIGDAELVQLQPIWIRVYKLEADDASSLKEWRSHRGDNSYNNLKKPDVSPTEFDVFFNRSGVLFEDIKASEHLNAIISPRRIGSSNAPGTCFTKGSVTISEGVSIHGDIFAKGDVIVYGTVTGDIWSEGSVTVYGSVIGSVNAWVKATTAGSGVIAPA